MNHTNPPGKITTGQQAAPVSLAAHRRNRVYTIITLSGLLGLTILVASTIGSAQIPFRTSFAIILSRLPLIDITPAWPRGFETIILYVRLPRIMMAGLVGAALAVAGAAYQGLLRNPLADPYLIGVAPGAGLGATIGFLVLLTFPWIGFGLIPLFAFIGALGAVAVVYTLARVGKTLPITTLILAGVAIGAFLSAITSYLFTHFGRYLHGIIFWLMGGLSMSNWNEVRLIFPWIIIGIVVIWIHFRPLNVMQLDEDQAQQLGIKVERVKIILIIAATLITAVAVSFTGLIGFVGLIIPHAVRLIWGPDHRYLLPLSALVGSIFLILADAAAHGLIPPREIPVGVVTALCGAPFFLYLLRRKKGLSFF
ncbi:iron chelate uptake ABC transporter family permease subunit [Candidatus Acetothermia bacterium]|nr:iron chelate uptake ABC transporter family permease subunit [Candidatus Acetothermia bacterium]